MRDPAALDAPDGVEPIKGTPTDIDDIRRAADGTDAVISVLNNARASDNPWARPVSPPDLMTRAARDTVAVMGELGITRIVATSSQGVGDDWHHLNPVLRGIIRLSNIKHGFADHDGVDAVLRGSELEWTLVRAVALTDKPATGPIRAALRGHDRPAPFVNRVDLARFLVDTVETDTWVRQTPLVWNERR